MSILTTRMIASLNLASTNVESEQIAFLLRAVGMMLGLSLWIQSYLLVAIFKKTDKESIQKRKTRCMYFMCMSLVLSYFGGGLIWYVCKTNIPEEEILQLSFMWFFFIISLVPGVTGFLFSLGKQK